jgi:pimeloyl-ACP methyl ester carboxylesterase
MKALAALALAAVLSSGLFGCRSQGASPGLELQTEDYRTARSRFKTRLVRKGPAPQEFQPFTLPKDAQAMTYSKERSLKALVGPIPTDGKKHPAVLFLHGGFAMDGSDWEASQAFRDAGYVMMMPLLRGENGQPGSYSMFYDELTDVLAAGEALAALPFVDKERVYVAGHSVGGTLALLAALSGKRFRAAASFSGSCDQVAWSSGQEEVIPFDPTDRAEFRMRSPIAYATSFQCPTRIYYGSAEGGFAGMSQQTAQLAKTKNLDVEAVQVSGDHFSALDGEIAASIAFFRSH